MPEATKVERKPIHTPPFRVSFPKVFTPSSYQGGEPKFSLSMLFYPAKFDDDAKKAWREMQRIADEASMGKFEKRIKDLPGNFRRPFRKGDEKAHLDGYGEGCIFAAASSKQKPGVIDRDRQPILTEADLYPGCWARASVTAYAYDNKGKGVAFGLQNVQKLGEGKNFTGRQDAAEDFGDDAGSVWTPKDEDLTGTMEDDDPTA